MSSFQNGWGGVAFKMYGSVHPLYKNIKDSILNNFLKEGGAYQIEEGVSNREGGGA